MLFSTMLFSQDSLIVTYLKVGSTLIPMETPVIHDTLYYYEGGFEWDTLKQVDFTWVDGFNQVNYSTGYLVEEQILWVTALSAYAQPVKSTSQYYVVSHNRRFLFKNYLVDEDEYSQVRLTSKVRKKKWWQKPDYYILELYER